MPLQATSGAASYDAFGGGVAAVPNYIEDVFSTWLYTGNSSTQSISNGIDLAGKGGMTWLKCRNNTFYNSLYDTVRGATNVLYSNDTLAQQTYSGVTSFDSTGFTLGSTAGNNGSPYLFASWTFREQPKFFDVVTWTGDSTSAQTISHNLGSVPGCIIVKRIDTATNWIVYHRGMNGGTNPLDFWMKLNLTDAQSSGVATNFWANTNPTATDFTVGPSINSSSGTYVAYLFAHNAGGFGLTGTDNVISCGSYTGNGSTTGPVVTLGYEPQWLLIKDASGANDWVLIDSMRGLVVGGAGRVLFPNDSLGEYAETFISPSATGFNPIATDSKVNASGRTYIYIAIRRGPMRTPTTGTSVFAASKTGSSTPPTFTSNFPVDMAIRRADYTATQSNMLASRLQGTKYMLTNLTDAEQDFSAITWDFMNGWYGTTVSATPVSWMFRRAPGFFDEVCYTGTGSARTVAHNLGVAPELMIVKDRSSTQGWSVYAQPLGATNALVLQTTAAVDTGTSRWNSTTPTSTVFSLGSSSFVNANTQTFVAYLFASCPGVSKVFSYTGNGSSQTINCGFTGGARFVMIKRTDSTGDWYVWDTARGIVANNDPHLSLNSTAAEVTTNDTIDTDSTGFVVNQVAATNVNVSSATYIGLAIA